MDVLSLNVIKRWIDQGQKTSYRILRPELFLKDCQGASLVAQWLRICLPIQGRWARALVWEDPTWHGATKLVRHNYWACALEPVSHNYWAHVPQLLKPARLEPVLRNKEQPPLTATRESLHAATKTQRSQK